MAQGRQCVSGTSSQIWQCKSIFHRTPVMKDWVSHGDYLKAHTIWQDLVPWSKAKGGHWGMCHLSLDEDPSRLEIPEPWDVWRGQQLLQSGAHLSLWRKSYMLGLVETEKLFWNPEDHEWVLYARQCARWEGFIFLDFGFAVIYFFLYPNSSLLEYESVEFVSDFTGSQS